MELFVEIIHVLVALFMILVVLVQGGNQGGTGAAFGGGSSAGVFGATGATTLLGKLTYASAGIFMITSLVLTVMQGRSGNIGLEERLKKQSAAMPASPSPPADAPAAAPVAASPATEAPAPSPSAP